MTLTARTDRGSVDTVLARHHAVAWPGKGADPRAVVKSKSLALGISHASLLARALCFEYHGLHSQTLAPSRFKTSLTF